MKEGYHEESNQATANRLQAVTSLYRLNVIMKNPTRPQQTELPLALDDEGPLAPVEVTDGELAPTLAELRAAGFEVWAMDIKGATYRLHVRRVAPPHVKKTVTPPPPRPGYEDERSLRVTHFHEITS